VTDEAMLDNKSLRKCLYFSKVSKLQKDRTVVNRSTKMLREIRMAGTHFQLAGRTLDWNFLQTLVLKCWNFFLRRP